MEATIPAAPEIMGVEATGRAITAVMVPATMGTTGVETAVRITTAAAVLVVMVPATVMVTAVPAVTVKTAMLNGLLPRTEVKITLYN